MSAEEKLRVVEEGRQSGATPESNGRIERIGDK